MHRTAPIQVALNAEVVPQGGKAPKSIELIPSGNILGLDGRKWLMETVDAQRVVNAYQDRRLKLPVDVNHATQLAAPAGGASPAAGWIERIEIRNGAIWGDVDWTPSGEAAVLNREYKYISPVFDFDPASKRVVRLVSAGLVNTPNLLLQALNHFDHHENTMNRSALLMAAIAASLSLAQDASDDDVGTAINALKAKADDTSQALNAEKNKAPSLDQYVPRADYDATVARATNAETALAQREKADHDKDVETAINAALNAGKITPATLEYHRAACAQEGGLDRFKAFISTAPAIAAESGLEARRPTGEVTALNAEQKIAADALGISEADYLKQLAASK